jgi:uncharacterized protein
MNQDNSASKRGKTILAGLAMVLIAGVVTVSILRDRIVNQPNFQIQVNGQGKVAYAPEIASINMGVEIPKTAKAEDALNQLNEKMNKIFEAIEREGIPRANISTQNYTLAPTYDYKDGMSPTPSGYTANQILSVRIEDMGENNEKVSKVISEASKAGVNRINGIAFEPKDLNELKQQARLKAIADARSKAGDISGSLGVELGEIVGWWENYSLPQGKYYGEYGMGGGGGPVMPGGSEELVMEVNISYRLK